MYGKAQRTPTADHPPAPGRRGVYGGAQRNVYDGPPTGAGSVRRCAAEFGATWAAGEAAIVPGVGRDVTVVTTYGCLALDLRT